MKRWIESNSLDTTLIFKDKTIQLKPSSSGDFDPYFLSNELINSLTKDFGNFYKKSLAIEEYQLGKFGSRVRREGNELFVKLDDGSWLQLRTNPNYDEVGHTFEYYFDKIGFYSIRVQWGEGNGYKLVNSKTGKVTDIIGRPFFSPDGTFIVALGNDIEAGYSTNGFQLLSNNSGSIIGLGIFSPTSWGCESAIWLSNNKLTLKNESLEYSNTNSNYFNFYTELVIK
ncbi:hypothetical protein AWN68_10195 [Roseivirga echinicomitans]|uniref:Uncharacterized protein n=2 Tax=Roseivirga echinicomitans TaxID=296218 RepID=A0A150X388_9BACT|nr:hypothetical protein AWN68_10195 [Roseivirga echinicomitans]